MTIRRLARVSTTVAVAGLGCALVGACNGIPPEPFVVADAASRTPAAPPPLTAEALVEPFRQFAAAHPGEISLAWAPVGGTTPPQVLGRTTDSDAWSTLKVPISVAALAKAGAQPTATEKSRGRTRAQVRAAIEWSDNEAAAQLYRGLGASAAAADAVEAVLRAGGDARTEVGVDAGGKSAGFGRTHWRVEDAATYAAHLPCASDAAFVYDEMSRIDEDQQWGLGAVKAPSRFKGGWGPSAHGHLVRQIGTVEQGGGRTAIAFIVAPEDGTHETATATASALSTWLATRLGPADAGTCPAG
ncbi:hypothetical protein [Mobilicoccus massiliensis]|uniref:hypothetical protein n=1 Tax=Mobilicoccus massiliensis TaxID=1522310 RepID=UPI000694910F|nr:hypothetical protein [Mobilicoccus massiliensis]